MIKKREKILIVLRIMNSLNKKVKKYSVRKKYGRITLLNKCLENFDKCILLKINFRILGN